MNSFITLKIVLKYSNYRVTQLTGLFLKGQCHEHFVLTETVGVYRIGPTYVPHLLSTSVLYTVTLICYDGLKMASIEVKRISSLCNV